MINLRYHIVSLVAVFLALGVGIVMGSTVIDRVTVDTLNNRLEQVRDSVNGMRNENRRLNEQLATVGDFADQARDEILEDRLDNVPVLVLAVTGIDRKPVDALNQALVVAGAEVQGTVWFNPKLRLDNEGDRRALAAGVSAQPDNRQALLRHVLARLAAAARPATPGGERAASPLPVLEAGNFVAYDGPPESAETQASPSTSTTVAAIRGIAGLPAPNTRFVVVSGAGAQVGDDILAGPLVEALVAANVPVVAAESGQDSPGGRAVFVGLLRGNGNLAARLSTVDNLESSMGQAAVVLAVEDLGVPRTGHFGVGPGAQRLLPAPPA